MNFDKLMIGQEIWLQSGDERMLGKVRAFKEAWQQMTGSRYLVPVDYIKNPR